MGWSVELKGITAGYGCQTVYSNLDLKVEDGEFIGIIGPNGAGKSTLLNLINGLSFPQRGEVIVNNQVLNKQNRRELCRKIAYVPQSTWVDQRLPLLLKEVVLMGSYGKLGLGRYPGRREKELAEKIIKMTGIADLKEKPIGHLSGGERQKAAIARALVQEPKILLLDEPTASLDWRAGQEILDLIYKIQQQFKLTTFLVTHEINQLPHWCSKMVLVKKGCLVGVGKTEMLFREDILTQLYDVPLKIVYDGETPSVLYGRSRVNV